MGSSILTTHHTSDMSGQRHCYRSSPSFSCLIFIKMLYHFTHALAFLQSKPQPRWALTPLPNSLTLIQATSCPIAIINYCRNVSNNLAHCFHSIPISVWLVWKSKPYLSNKANRPGHDNPGCLSGEITYFFKKASLFQRQKLLILFIDITYWHLSKQGNSHENKQGLAIKTWAQQTCQRYVMIRRQWYRTLRVRASASPSIRWEHTTHS